MLRQVLRELRHETALQHAGRERNQVAPEQGRFLAWLLETLGARRVIEVGVFTGYSSLAMALVRCPPWFLNPPSGCLMGFIGLPKGAMKHMIWKVCLLRSQRENLPGSLGEVKLMIKGQKHKE